MLDRYHLYLYCPGGSRLAKTIQEACHWKRRVTQAELYNDLCKKCNQFKNRKTLYECLPPNNIAELKLWDTVHVDLIVSYSKSTGQQQPCRAIININVSLTCMAMIDPETGLFEIFEVPTFYLNELTDGNDEYIDKSSVRVIQLFNKKWICRYPRLQKVVFETISEFEQGFTTFLVDFYIEPVLSTIKNPQDNTPVEKLHQVILKTLVTNDLDNNVFGYIDSWGETLESIAWAIRVSYHCTVGYIPTQDVFGRDIIFSLTPVV